MKTIAEYRPVAFRDITTGDIMVIRSTVETQSTIEHGGRELPLFDLDVSSHSHPAYTGAASRYADSGRIERFKRRYAC